MVFRHGHTYDNMPITLLLPTYTMTGSYIWNGREEIIPSILNPKSIAFWLLANTNKLPKVTKLPLFEWLFGPLWVLVPYHSLSVCFLMKASFVQDFLSESSVLWFLLIFRFFIFSMFLSYKWMLWIYRSFLYTCLLYFKLITYYRGRKWHINQDNEMCLKCFIANLLHFRKYIVYQVFEIELYWLKFVNTVLTKNGEMDRLAGWKVGKGDFVLGCVRLIL